MSILVNKDTKKAIHHWKIAAMYGHEKILIKFFDVDEISRIFTLIYSDPFNRLNF